MSRGHVSKKPMPGYNISLDAALKQGGFYGKDGVWNSLVKIDGKILRGRVETLVFKKDQQQVFMQVTNYNKKKYRIPGGSFEKDLPNYIQAQNEVNEEARIKVKNLVNSGQHYIHIYKDKKYIEDIDDRLLWDGTYTEVYIGEYDGPYTGHIDERDKDDEMYKNGKFHNLHEVHSILNDTHKRIVDEIFPVINKGAISESMIVLQESNNEIHYYPYYTPREMSKLGVFNESKNRYSDIEDEAIEWYLEYTDTLLNPDSENWLKELKDRYEEYTNQPTLENKQAVLHLGWNPEVPVTLENVLKASDRTKERINIKESKIITIDEGLIFSEKDIVHNIDDFDSGKSNIIFITGMSGSGKTTLSSEMEKQYGAKIIHLDYFQNYNRVKKIGEKRNHITDKYIDKYFKENPEIEEQSERFSDIDLREFKNYFVPFFNWLIKELAKDKNTKYVVEGIHIMLYIPYKDIKNYPLYCVNTSSIKSITRHWMRDGWGINEILKYGYNDIISFCRWNNKYEDFKDSITEARRVQGYTYANSDSSYAFAKNTDDKLLDLYKHSSSSTSTGRGGVMDSIAQHDIQDIDIQKEKAILESNNIVKEYIDYVNLNIEKFKKAYSSDEKQSQMANNVAGYIEHLEHYGIDDKKISDMIMGDYFGLQYIIDMINNLKKDNKSDNDIDNELETNMQCQKLIRSILQMRLNYVNRMTGIMSNMIKANYKMLGLTEKEAEIYINSLMSGGNDAVKTAGEIKELIRKNKDKFYTNDGSALDLRSIGFGVILTTKEDLGYFSGNDEDALFSLLQKAMRYDAVIVAHGSSRFNGDYYASRRDLFFWWKDAGDKDVKIYLKKTVDRFDTMYNGSNLELYEMGKSFANDLYDNYRYRSEAIRNMLENIGDSIENSSSFDGSAPVIKRRFIELIKSKNKNKIGAYIYKISLKYANDIYSTIISDNLYRGIEDDVSRIKNKIFADGIRCVFFKMVVNKVLSGINGLLITDDNESQWSERWTCQPVSTLEAGPFTDVNELVRQLIKEGYKKILIECCNPGHHTLDDDIMAAKGVIINYSDFSNFMESSSVLEDDSTDIITNLENELREFASSNDIDWDDDTYLNECVEWCQTHSDIELLNEGRIIDTLMEIFKRIIAAIVGFIKKIFSFFKKLVSAVKSLFVGTPEEPKDTKVKFTKIDCDIIDAKQRKVVTITGTTRNELKIKADKINGGIANEITLLKNNQSQSINRMKQDIARLEQEAKKLRAS